MAPGEVKLELRQWMGRAFFASSLILALVTVAGFGMGCAAKRVVLSVERDVPEDPERGAPVRIVRVTDRRVFRELPKQKKRVEADPKTWASRENHPFVPQLETGGIDDKAVTVRAVAQKRNPETGKVSHDLLLPEELNVEALSRRAMVEAFRKSGYRVLEPGGSGYESSYPIEADVEQFWAWNGLGEARFEHYTDRSASAHAVHFDVVLRITAGFQPFEWGHRVEGSATLHSMLWVNRGSFANAVAAGLDDLVDNLERELKAARSSLPPAFAPSPMLAPEQPPRGPE